MKRSSPVVRILFSAALLGLVFYLVQRQKSSGGTGSAAAQSSSRPFRSKAPSSEGANQFAWVPRYPGAEIADIHSKLSREEISYGYEFQVKDDLAKVLSFYEERLRGAGFQVSRPAAGKDVGNLHGENPGTGRTIDVNARQLADAVDVGVLAVER